MESARDLTMKKTTRSKRKMKKTVSPNYITYNGSTYEKLSDDSVNVELDMQEDVLDDLNNLVKSGKFVSIGDAVRYILRRKLEEVESQTE